MARNMINANGHVFSQLLERARLALRPLEDVDKARWIKTDDVDRRWLQELVVKHIERLSPRLRTAVIQFEGRSFFVAAGFENAIEPGFILNPIELNAGMLTALIPELNVPVRQFTSPLEIIETILPQFKGLEGYSGHDLSAVAELFEPISIYEIDANSPISAENLTQLSCYWIVKNRERMVLPFSQETLLTVEEIAMLGVDTLPFGSLLNSLQSAHWQHAFLEAYRCVERLFAFQIIEKLHAELAVRISLLEFAAKIENVTGWRPKEEDAIDRLCVLLPTAAESLFENVRIGMGGSVDQKIARWLYELRNSVVHFRPATKQVHLNDVQWDEIFRATLLLIDKIYSNYDRQLKAA
jgi:hypothetical protein